MKQKEEAVCACSDADRGTVTKKIVCLLGGDLASSGRFDPATGRIGPWPPAGDADCETAAAMKKCRMHIFYSGHVQGVGFRYTVKSVAAGFEIVGTVRNLLDGRVQMIAEGTREELEAFRQAIHEAGLKTFVRNEDVSWEEPTGEFRGFEIVR